MKRALCACLALFLLLPLTACGEKEKEKQIQGLVTEIQTGEGGELTALVVQTQGGEPAGVLVTEDTRLTPGRDGSYTLSEIWAEFRPDVQISARCAPQKQMMSTGEGGEITAYQADFVDITGRLVRGAVTLEDGAAVDLLEDGFPSDHTYLLPDGTRLLNVRGPSGPEGCYVMGLESFADLSQQAQEKISAYYQERGLLYDEEEELEKAYAAYLKKGADFQSYLVEQDVSPSASSEKVMYFRTDVTLPLDQEGGGTIYTLALGDAFDRETGERLALWDLFRCPEEEARRAILDAALDWTGSGGVRAGMEATFTPERVIVSSDGLSINYEPGTLPGEEHGYIVYADLNKIQDLMYGWAVPMGTE